MDPEFTLEVPEAVAAAGDAILSVMPEPQQHAIAQHESEQQEAEDNAQRDANGEAFNPAIHSGSLLKNGTWRRKKSAGPNTSARAGTIGRGKRSNATVGDAPAQPDNSAEVSARAAGIAAAGAVLMIGVAVGGEEWQPRKDPIDEREMLTGAFGDYFVAKGVTDFPPGVALFLALSMYAAPRFTMPQTRTRMQRFKDWIAIKVLTRRMKKKGASQEDIAKAVDEKRRAP